MPSVSLVTGHIDEPDNGVYCKDCEYSIFNEGSYFGVCKIGRLFAVAPVSYCAAGGVEKNTTKGE